jgi:hypothetical protein
MGPTQHAHAQLKESKIEFEEQNRIVQWTFLFTIASS